MHSISLATQLVLGNLKSAVTLQVVTYSIPWTLVVYSLSLRNQVFTDVEMLLRESWLGVYSTPLDRSG